MILFPLEQDKAGKAWVYLIMKKMFSCIISVSIMISLSACGNASAPSTEAGASSVAPSSVSEETRQTGAAVPGQADSSVPQPEEASVPQPAETSASEQAALPIEDFWKTEGDTDGVTLTFATGLEIILPEDWAGKTVLFTELGGQESHPTRNTLIVCEKTNAEANAGGVLFYLDFCLHEEGSEYGIFGLDKVLGTYKQGDAEYALIFGQPREMNYVEGDEAMKKAYESLNASVDKVRINTDAITGGFTPCETDDLDWIAPV